MTITLTIYHWGNAESNNCLIEAQADLRELMKGFGGTRGLDIVKVKSGGPGRSDTGRWELQADDDKASERWRRAKNAQEERSLPGYPG